MIDDDLRIFPTVTELTVPFFFLLNIGRGWHVPFLLGDCALLLMLICYHIDASCTEVVDLVRPAHNQWSAHSQFTSGMFLIADAQTYYLSAGLSMVLRCPLFQSDLFQRDRTEWQNGKMNACVRQVCIHLICAHIWDDLTLNYLREGIQTFEKGFLFQLFRIASSGIG
jgi:hypothetical protein